MRIVLYCLIIYFSVADSFAQHVMKPLVNNQVELFSLGEVQITDGDFRHIQDLDHQYLLTLDPDRLLSWFRREAGLTPKAQPYPFGNLRMYGEGALWLDIYLVFICLLCL